jgi:asparagine N-glycosylation enzyme membrane subunit Stt3
MGFAIRYIPFLHKLMIDDTYYQYIITKSIVENGHAPESLELANYPKGSSLLKAPLLLPFTIAYTYKLFQSFGISLVDYMIIFPSIFGALASIPLYFLVERLFSKKIALMTAFFYVIIPASIDRTFAGFVEKESLAALFIFIWLFFFIRSYKELGSKKYVLIFPILSGVFMGLSFLTWRGVAYFALLIAFSVFMQTLIRPNKNLSITVFIMSLLGYATMYLAQPTAYPLSNFILNYRFSPLIFVSIFAILSVLPEQSALLSKIKIKSVYVFFFFTLLSILLIFILNLQEGFYEMIRLTIRDFSGGKTRLAFEAQRANLADYTIKRNPFSYLVFFIAPGLYYYLKDSTKNFDFSNLFVLTWLVTGAYASYLQVRLFFILAPVASMLIAYGFFRLIAPSAVPLKKPTSLKLKRENGWRRESLMINFKAYFVLLLIFLSIIGTMKTEVRYAGNLKEVLSERLNHWENAMVSLREITPEDSIIFAWWNYGYIIQALGERATIADPGGGLKRRLDIARILTSNEKKALKIVKKYNKNNKPMYFVVSYDEFFLSKGINRLANDSLYISSQSFPSSNDPAQDARVINDFIKN